MAKRPVEFVFTMQVVGGVSVSFSNFPTPLNMDVKNYAFIGPNGGEKADFAVTRKDNGKLCFGLTGIYSGQFVSTEDSGTCNSLCVPSLANVSGANGVYTGIVSGLI